MYVDMVKMNFTREQLAKNSDYASRKINIFACMGLQHAKLCKTLSFYRTYRTHGCLGLTDATTNTEHAAEDNQWIS